MTRIIVSVIVLILTATTLAPSAAFAYSGDNIITPYGKSIALVKPHTDLKVPSNAGEDSGISVIPLAGQNTITPEADTSKNKACANLPSQNRGTVPPPCLGHLVVIKHVVN
jgi:hypothetical protein